MVHQGMILKHLTPPVPKAITEQILEFCRTIDATQSPVFIKVQPKLGHHVNECFPNVLKTVATHGGFLQHGWSIWEQPDVLIEGIFHGVWKGTSGTLIDVTPHVDGEKEILFLPDSKRIYNNVPVDNLRMPLTKDPALLARFKRMENFNALRAKYNVDGRSSSIPVNELLTVIKGASVGEIIHLLGQEMFEDLVKHGDIKL